MMRGPRGFLTVCGVVLVLVGLSGCDPVRERPATPTPTTVVPSTPVVVPTGPRYETTTHTFVMDNGHGHQMSATITLGPWLKGSNPDVLDSAWYQLTGEVGIPLPSGTYRDEAKANPIYLRSKDAAYIFGTATLENLSPERDPDDFRKVTSGWRQDLPEFYLQEGGFSSEEAAIGDEFGLLFYCVQGTCVNQRRAISPIIPFEAQFDGKQRIEVPFAVAVPRVFGTQRMGWAPDLTEHRFTLKCMAAASIEPGGITSGDPITTTISWEDPENSG